MDTNAIPTDATIAEKSCMTVGYISATYSLNRPRNLAKMTDFMISKLIMKTGDTSPILFALSLLKANDLWPKAPTVWNSSPNTKDTAS